MGGQRRRSALTNQSAHASPCLQGRFAPPARHLPLWTLSQAQATCRIAPFIAQRRSAISASTDRHNDQHLACALWTKPPGPVRQPLGIRGGIRGRWG